MCFNIAARIAAVDSFTYVSSRSSVNHSKGTLPARTSEFVALANAHRTKASRASGDVSHHASSSPRRACNAMNLTPDDESNESMISSVVPASVSLPRPEEESARLVASSASLLITWDGVTSARVQSRRPTCLSSAFNRRSSFSIIDISAAYMRPALALSFPTNSRTHQSYLAPHVTSKFIFQMNGTPLRAHSIAERKFRRILASVNRSGSSPKILTPGLLYRSK